MLPPAGLVFRTRAFNIVFRFHVRMGFVKHATVSACSLFFLAFCQLTLMNAFGCKVIHVRWVSPCDVSMETADKMISAMRCYVAALHVVDWEVCVHRNPCTAQ